MYWTELFILNNTVLIPFGYLASCAWSSWLVSQL